MKLRTKYLLFITLLHLVTLWMSFLIFKEHKLIFIISEVFILISMAFSWALFQQLVHPLKTLVEGINAIRDQDFSVKFRRTGKQEVDQLVDVYNKMIDSLREERTLQEEQHQFLEKLISTSPTGVVIMDYDHHIEQMNPKARQLMGIGEDDNLELVMPACGHPLIKQIGELPPGQPKMVSISGIENYKCQKSSFIDRGFRRYFVMIEELSAEILQTEKKAYGKVIRMMAHEVNNTVGPVNSIMDFATEQEGISPRLKEALTVAIERNNNLNLFMKGLADVVRLPAPAIQLIDLNAFVADVSKLFEYRSAERNVKLDLRLHHEPLYFKADRQQMEQVLLNLIKNSLEAVGGRTEGSITLMTVCNPLRIVVRDNGHGIPADAQVNLFTPFYTTKRDGQGIGLTLVREILLNHGFGFSLKTGESGETDFTIVIPPAAVSV